MDDVIFNKAESIERCLKQIYTYYRGHENIFSTDQLRQDAILLNLQRACELAIDLAAHIVRIKNLGIPKKSRDFFSLLKQAGIIPEEMAEKLEHMVGFRNIAVHEYQEINLDVVKSILDKELPVFSGFTRLAIALSP